MHVIPAERHVRRARPVDHQLTGNVHRAASKNDGARKMLFKTNRISLRILVRTGDGRPQ